MSACLAVSAAGPAAGYTRRACTCLSCKVAPPKAARLCIRQCSHTFNANAALRRRGGGGGGEAKDAAQVVLGGAAPGGRQQAQQPHAPSRGLRRGPQVAGEKQLCAADHPAQRKGNYERHAIPPIGGAAAASIKRQAPRAWRLVTTPETVPDLLRRMCARFIGR